MNAKLKKCQLIEMKDYRELKNIESFSPLKEQNSEENTHEVEERKNEDEETDSILNKIKEENKNALYLDSKNKPSLLSPKPNEQIDFITPKQSPQFKTIEQKEEEQKHEQEQEQEQEKELPENITENEIRNQIYLIEKHTTEEINNFIKEKEKIQNEVHEQINNKTIGKEKIQDIGNEIENYRKKLLKQQEEMNSERILQYKIEKQDIYNKDHQLAKLKHTKNIIEEIIESNFNSKVIEKYMAIESSNDEEHFMNLNTKIKTNMSILKTKLKFIEKVLDQMKTFRQQTNLLQPKRLNKNPK
jgi:hypothetical protein